ncbi:MAG: hypothetical protein RMJ53_05970 [Chitinophagales bacterium]|nr:hypothetical protein [Chitinophagales bacterium]MDW8273757.1 hypothetical protein [Chitinophagales bacterium]
MKFYFIGINTYSTFLMALLMGAIPFLVYYFLWESLDLRQEMQYNHLFRQSIPVFILLSFVFMGLGVYLSMKFIHVETNEKNCYIKVFSPIRLFFPRRITFRWDEVDSMMLDEDFGKTTLTIYLRGNRRFDLSYSLLLRGNSDFRAFVSVLGLNTGL